MQSQPRALAQQDTTVPSIPIIESRQQYTACHVKVEDSQQQLAAICVSGAYYSFFRIERSQPAAFKVGLRLDQRGDTPIITKIPKGYAVWVLEPDAQPVPKTPATQAIAPPKPRVPYKILVDRQQYQPCHIQLPSSDRRLAAILFDGHYYSLFKAIEDLQQALPIVRRLSYRGDEVAITKTAKGFGLWILEAEAHLSEPG
jgi:hypothetical protein